jgi:LPXTG-motif cell wall-anchored protein
MGSDIKLSKIFVGLLIMLVSTGSVLAFGVSSPYYKNHPLEMYPGETREVAFNLQNCPALLESCDPGDVTVSVEFEEGGEVAEIISGLNYLVPYGTASTNLIVRVSVPADANVGDSYNVQFSLSSPPPEEEGGTVQVGIRYGISFPVEVVGQALEEPETPATPPPPEPTTEPVNWLLWIGIALVVIVILIVILLLRKKREEEIIK